MLKNITNKPLVLSYSAFNLTKVGNELLPIVGRESENSIYLFELGRAIQADNTNLKVSMENYEIVEDESEGMDLLVSIRLKQYRDFGTKRANIKFAQGKPKVKILCQGTARCIKGKWHSL